MFLSVCRTLRCTRPGDWVAETKELAPGVFTARTLLPPEDQFAAVRVVNLSTKPFTVRAGLCMGLADSAECLSGYGTRDGRPTDPAVRGLPVRTVQGREANEGSPDSLPAHVNALMDQLEGLSTEEEGRVRKLLEQYAGVFSASEFDLGRTPLMEHRIDTGYARPLRQGLRRHPQAHLGIIDEQVGNLLAAGLIEESRSPWASNVVLVKKAEAGAAPRCTIDHRGLNLLTYKDAYPLPNIGACLDALEGCLYFSTLDLRSGFYQVPLHPDDADKTAHITRRGQFRFKVLSMGLCNAPSCFQRLMDSCLGG